MTISSIAYFNYQSAANVSKKNKSQNNLQMSADQVAFKGITKHTLVKTQNGNNTIKLVLASLGASLMSVLGIKSAEDNNFDKIVDSRKQSISRNDYKENYNEHKKIKKAYKRNPELVKDLMLSKITQERFSSHNVYDTSDLEYSNNAIVLIEEYSHKHPELTNLYKACLSNSYINFKTLEDANNESFLENSGKELLDLVTQNPKKALQMLDQAGYKSEKYYEFNEPKYYPAKLAKLMLL